MIEVDRAELPSRHIFSEESRDLLESSGAKILVIGDQTLASLAHQGFKIRYQEYPELAFETSVLMEVAIWPEKDKFFHPKSLYCNWQEHQDLLKGINDASSVEFPGAIFIRGNAGDWAHICALMEGEGVELFSYRMTEVEGGFSGRPNIFFGDFREGLGPRVARMTDDRRFSVGLARLAVAENGLEARNILFGTNRQPFVL